MPVLAIINAKGGSGKSTVATTVSAYAVKVGAQLILGDLDTQQSVRIWLRLRPSSLPAIPGWLLDAGRAFRTPVGVTHAILDTPSGLSGHHLARVVMASNLVIVPVAASAFDRDAAEACIENMRRMPRVVSGLCVIAILGMRIPQGSSAERMTRAWAVGLDIKFLGVVRYSPLYVTLADAGSSIFDDAGEDATSLRDDWKPLIDWLGETYLGTVPKPEAKRVSQKMVNNLRQSNPKLASFHIPFALSPVTLLSTGTQLTVSGATEISGKNSSTALTELTELAALSPVEHFSGVVDGAAANMLDLPIPSQGFFASVKRKLWVS